MSQYQTATDIPAPWRQSAQDILSAGWRKILVLGEADCGKSTYCRFLADALICAGFTTDFVDADIGQKDVGPPGTVSLAHLSTPGSWSDTTASALYFVGALTPAGHFLPLVVGTRRLVDAAQAPFVIIDTTGLIRGSGVVLKGYQVESLRPDVIVAISHADELERIIKAHRHYSVLRLPSSPKARKKSPRRRATARAQAFRDYFRNAADVNLELKKLVVQRSALFGGEPLSDARFIYSERLPEGVIAITEQAGFGNERGLKTLPVGFERGLLCGVTDADGETLGLAIIDEIRFEQGTINLYTPVTPERIRVLQFGEIYLGRDGREQRRKRLHLS